MDFETEIPPPVIGWLVQLHQKAAEKPNSTIRVKYQVEGVYYTVALTRYAKKLEWEAS